VQSLFFRVIKIKAKGNKRGSARRVTWEIRQTQQEIVYQEKETCLLLLRQEKNKEFDKDSKSIFIIVTTPVLEICFWDGTP